MTLWFGCCYEWSSSVFFPNIVFPFSLARLDSEFQMKLVYKNQITPLLFRSGIRKLRLQGQSGPPAVFVNKVLLERSHFHLLTYGV